MKKYYSYLLLAINLTLLPYYIIDIIRYSPSRLNPGYLPESVLLIEQILVGIIVLLDIVALVLLFSKPSEKVIKKDFMEMDGIEDLFQQYTAKQLKELRSIDQIENLSIDQLESKIRELITINIDKFSQLLLLEGVKPPSNNKLVDLAYSRSSDIIDSVKEVLRTYLRAQLLETDLSEFDVKLEIDNLLSKYEDMELMGIGKD